MTPKQKRWLWFAFWTALAIVTALMWPWDWARWFNTTNLDHSLYCNLYADIPTCVAAVVAQGGGEAIIPSGSKLSLTTSLILGDADGTPVVLHIQRGGDAKGSVPGGAAYAIAIGKGSSIRCDEGYHQLAESGRVPEFVMGAAASMVDFITNLDHTGLQGTANIDGCYFIDPGGTTGTISGQVVHYVNLEMNTHMRDTVMEGFPNGDIKIENVSGNGTSSYSLDNVVANCSALAGCTPLVIQGHPAGTVALVRVNGGQYTHAGTGLPQIDCEGAGGSSGNAPNGLWIGGGAYLEASFANAIGVKIRDCHDVTFAGVSAAGGGGDMFNLSQSEGNLTYNINWFGIYNNNWTNTIHDTINTKLNTTSSLACANFTSTITTCTQTVGSGTSTSNGTQLLSGTSQAQPAITIKGATITDVATCALNAAPVATWQTGIQLLPPVVTANTVTPWLSNPTAGSITPAAAVIRCTVIR